MRRAAGLLAVALGLSVSAGTALAQQAPMAKQVGPATISSVMQGQLGIVESQVVAAAEAMPADKYSFAPPSADGSYGGVRTFAQEVKHIATANYYFFDAILGQPTPAEIAANKQNNGPDSIQTKEQIVAYLKKSYALGHKAIATITARDATAVVSKPPVPFLNTRLGLASFACTHAMDHYGQMVEYLRMNGITPPASQGQPPANPAKQ